MIKDKNAADLRSIAHAGASLEVDGGAYNSDDLRAIAQALTEKATLKVCNSNSFNTESLRAIAHAKRGQVIFT